jgi:putative ABC transport system permease protein
MRPYALIYIYLRRLRVHAAQELLAGLGIAIAVALVFAVMVANSSVEDSGSAVVHAVAGPASLQLRTRNAEGVSERILARVEHLPGVEQAAPLLEQTATIVGPHTQITVDLAGTDISLLTLNGLAHSLPIAALSPGGIGLSQTSANALGITIADGPAGGAHEVLLKLRGATHPVKVTAVLGPEAFGALADAQVAVMPLERLQRLARLPGRITRVLVQPDPGREATVRKELEALGGDRLVLAPANQDLDLLHQALRPSDQASEFFAAISALLGFLFAFNAMLLTVPERRQVIADLRLLGTTNTAIVQMVMFESLCLGFAASLVGLIGGYLLSHDAFHQSAGYLAEAFTLNTNTAVGIQPLLLILIGGTLATCLAATVPLLDLRHRQALDAVYLEDGVPGNALGRSAQLRLALLSGGLVAFATAAFVLLPSLALLASAALAVATVLAMPLVFEGLLGGAWALTERWQRLTVLPVALTSLKAATLRSLALVATGAVALFGSVALGGARDDLLHGIRGFAHSYAADANIWVTNPDDNQAAIDFLPDHAPQRIARIPGIASVRSFQGSFLDLGDRRVWIIARPPGANREVLKSQIIDGSPTAAVARLGEGGWIALSQQIAEEHHVHVGGIFTLPTPTGDAHLRIAATTTNLAWSPGVVFMSTADYSRLWATSAPSALAVEPTPGTSSTSALAAIRRALGPANGLETSSAHTREARIDSLTGKGLSRLGEISMLLVIAAILAMAAALTSAIWQRRSSLAALRLSGVKPTRLRRILLMESTLMLSAGCLTGALAGLYGQVVIDGYLKHVTGFPVASIGANRRPIEIFALVILVVLAVMTVPSWLASRVSPALALEE